MDRRRLKILIGFAMVSLGLIQAGSFAVGGEMIFSFLGLVYAIIGVAYLWTEVYSPAE
ncbi:hypothetical protein SAMN04487950_2046 [Halogranum rubrum]|uniref:Uncharacterized protein n=2 Tax=Halogranum rubrum TaxID=553466 RepID=A0A1I4EAX7_9EURY|nr:hypothetical protein HSB1_12040 [Halogranum salarium B-1]SFL02974.1 hypothetical protein SAMN04487950_2046 [Halogranum rubrum]